VERVTREAALRCAAYWRERGADLAGYNALESADDLEALRQALGVPQLVLFGSSYGTQLALATMRRHPDLAARAILAGVQGPDDTWPLPGTLERRMEVLAELGLTGTFRTVVARLDSAPLVVRVARPADPGERAGGGDSVSLVIGGYDFLSFFAGLLDNPAERRRIPALLAAASGGDLSAVAPSVLEDRTPRSLGSAMAYTTMCASGASRARRERMTREAAGSVLAATPNVALATCDAWGARDLGEDYRQPVSSPVPVLLISGTADFTTPLEDAVAVLRGLPRGQHLILDGARHGPELVSHPEVIARMLDFLEGRPPASLRVRVR
jgi:pimeloyl-ACP methyl ester carboxylesterase